MFRYTPCALLFFFQAEDGIRDLTVTGVQTCALPICEAAGNFAPMDGVYTVADALREYFADRERRGHRSEEHTSELQSQSNLVCRLLLEKKKNQRNWLDERLAYIYSVRAAKCTLHLFA